MHPRPLFVAVATVAILMSGCGLREQDDRNEEVVLAMVEAINGRDLGALDGLIAADLRRHSAATPEVEVRSLDDFKTFLQADFASFPDSRVTVNRIMSEDDMVALHATYAATQEGPMGPFPATGKRMEVPFIGMLRIADGKIAEMWVEWDNLAGLTQLGHFPPGPLPEQGQGAGPSEPGQQSDQEL